MIRLYQPGDHLQIEPNEFSGWNAYEQFFELDGWIKYSLVDDRVRVIVGFTEYEPTRFALVGIFDKNLRARYGRELKELLENGISYLKATHIHTFSRACPLLNRWHNFLGFSVKNPEERQKIDGFDFYLWEKVIEWA